MVKQLFFLGVFRFLFSLPSLCFVSGIEMVSPYFLLINKVFIHFSIFMDQAPVFVSVYEFSLPRPLSLNNQIKVSFRKITKIPGPEPNSHLIFKIRNATIHFSLHIKSNCRCHFCGRLALHFRGFQKFWSKFYNF